MVPWSGMTGVCGSSPCDGDASSPAWSPSSFGRRQVFKIDGAGGQHPRDHRVRVPHLSCLQLIATPGRRGHQRDGVDDSPRTAGAIGDSNGARRSSTEIRDLSVVPASNLVAEHSPAPREAESDGSSGHHTAVVSPRIGDRSLLDHVLPLGKRHHERRVIEIAGITPLTLGQGPLEDSSTELHEVGSGTKRDPVEIHRALWIHG